MYMDQVPNLEKIRCDGMSRIKFARIPTVWMQTTNQPINPRNRKNAKTKFYVITPQVSIVTRNENVAAVDAWVLGSMR